MRSADFHDEGDLDLRSLRRTPARTAPLHKGWRRYIIGTVVAAVLVLFGTVVWLAYQDLMPGGDVAPPLIRAEAGPLKRAPDERGGLPVVNEQSVVVQALDEPDAPVRVERILPRQSTAPRSTADIVPEALEAEPAEAESVPARSAASAAEGVGAVADATPVAAPADTLDALIDEVAGVPEELRAIEPPAGAVVSTNSSSPVVFDPRPTAAATAGSAAEGTAGAGDGDVTVAAAEAADGIAAVPAAATSGDNLAPGLPITSSLARATPEAAATAAGSPAPTAATSTSPATPTSTAVPARSSAATATPAAAPTQTAALPAAPALATDFAGAFRVQLLAVRDEEAAAGAWASMQSSYPGVLGSLRSRVQRADLGESTFFRLQAGPFSDRTGAASVCAALQARGADCFVVEPTS